MEVVGDIYIYIYLSLHCHHQHDSCIKTGRDESHFNIWLIVRDKVTRQCPQTTPFEEKGEPKRIQTEVPLLTSRLTARPNRLTPHSFQSSSNLYQALSVSWTVNQTCLSPISVVIETVRTDTVPSQRYGRAICWPIRTRSDVRNGQTGLVIK